MKEELAKQVELQKKVKDEEKKKEREYMIQMKLRGDEEERKDRARQEVMK